jgi:Asp-tRNA(Asn)/Glu-tRNA(Gln) amidotransferase A subunit family amidase
MWFQIRDFLRELMYALSTEGRVAKKQLAAHAHLDSMIHSATPEHPSLSMSATAIAQKIRDGTFTCEGVMISFIRQSIRAHGCTNSVKSERYALALQEAKDCDKKIREMRQRGEALGSLPPFFGVPLSTKETFAYPGVLQTAGTWWLSTYVSKEKATVPQRLEEAGFLVFQNTAVCQLGMWMHLNFSPSKTARPSASSLAKSFAKDRNRLSSSYSAYGTHTRTSGGSSGGEGALLSAAGAPCGIGSDIGGSIRLPSAFCGLFGHKPSGSLVSNAKLNPTTQHPFMCCGPMCRYADDVLPLLELIRGPDGIDASCVEMDLVEVVLPLQRKLKEGAGAALRTSASLGSSLNEILASPVEVETTSPEVTSPKAEDDSGDEGDIGNGSGGTGGTDHQTEAEDNESGTHRAKDDDVLLVDRTTTSALPTSPVGATTVSAGISAAAIAGKASEDDTAAVAAAGTGLRNRRLVGGSSKLLQQGEVAEVEPLMARSSIRTVGGRPAGGFTSDPLSVGVLAMKRRLLATRAASSSSSTSSSWSSAGAPTVSPASFSPSSSSLVSASASSAARSKKITSWQDVTVFVVRDLDARPLFMPKVQPVIKKAISAAVYTMTGRTAEAAISLPNEMLNGGHFPPTTDTSTSTFPSDDGSYGCRGPYFLDLPEMKGAFDMWSAVLSSSSQPTFVELMNEGYGGTLDVTLELLKWCFGRSQSTLPALILCLIEDIPGKIMPGRRKELVKKCMELKERLNDLLRRTNGVLICPTYPQTAPLPDRALLAPFGVHWSCLWNVLETPVTVAPMGINKDDGMPVAVQIVGSHGFDRLTIGVAQALEHAGSAGWVPPSSVSTCLHCRFDGSAEPDWGLLSDTTRKKLAELGLKEAAAGLL